MPSAWKPLSRIARSRALTPWGHALDAAGLGHARLRADYTAAAGMAFRRYPLWYMPARFFVPPASQPYLFAVIAFGLHGDNLADVPVNRRHPGPLHAWNEQVRQGLVTGRAEQPFLRAFLHTVVARELSHADVHILMAGQAQQLTYTEYPTEEDYYQYIERINVPLNRLIHPAVLPGVPQPSAAANHANAEAVQRTDDLADLAKDLRSGKLTLPLTDLARFDVTRADLESGRDTPGVRDLLAHACRKARKALAAAEEALAPQSPEYQLLYRPGLIFQHQVMNTVERRGASLTRHPVSLPLHPSPGHLLDGVLRVLHGRLRMAVSTGTQAC
ncbi:squalene/phytoene synthase family protein [Streptomyces iconiensis]|uniref:Squalene/phytoene synthase family protein n=1 Tax=Streptomyces iconiensis TaxID=1384038 RepID=A0ABT7A0R0_9ACTN|nr:squalene/phytoene synthase family protein [Streptomyces iconiensis]MDJ1134218.1 squalene/phytoene synthase family protein [Streptomyces iconiensis]